MGKDALEIEEITDDKPHGSAMQPPAAASAPMGRGLSIDGVTKMPLQASIFAPSISLDGYEVVRGEFISQTGMPMLTFDGLIVSFNAASLKALPDVQSVLFMVSRRDNAVCVRPCRNGEKGGFRWCGYGNKRESRHGKCEEFVLRLMKFTSWTFDYRYKLLGSVVQNNGALMLKFDINSAQKIPRKNCEDEKLRDRTALIQPEEWNGEFGPSLAEHEKAVNMPIFQENTTIIIGDDKDGEAK